MLKNFQKNSLSKQNQTNNSNQTQIKQKTAVQQKPKIKKTMATLRLEKDIQSYMQQKISFVKLSFPQQSSLQHIQISITVEQPQSPYLGCIALFDLVFPDTYPIDPPKLKCLQHIYHPNINYEGSVCLPLLRQDYTPTVNLQVIICGLIFIMTFPNGQDALNPNIGDLMIKNYQMYRKIVQYTVQGRNFEGKPYDNIKIKNK